MVVAIGNARNLGLGSTYLVPTHKGLDTYGNAYASELGYTTMVIRAKLNLAVACNMVAWCCSQGLELGPTLFSIEYPSMQS